MSKVAKTEEPPRDLFLVVKGEWYWKIKDGSKRVEYRDHTDYWYNKFVSKDGTAIEYNTVTFQLGYSKKYPQLTFYITEIKFSECGEMIEIHFVDIPEEDWLKS